MSESITFAPIIPLIGGFPLGAEHALGVQPSAIYSYAAFAGNDSHYVNYQQNTLGRDVEYIDITKEEKYDSVDIVMCTPPCAALSSLNSSSNPEASGAGCAKNEWMYISITDAITKLDAKVVMVENAPALYTTKGKIVADNIYAIAKEYGYSMTLYKTSTMFHGIPQNRGRCFAILWKSKYAPYMEYFNKPCLSFSDYVESYSPDSINTEQTCEKLLDDPYYSFISNTIDEDVRELVKSSTSKTLFQYVYKNGLIDDAIEYFIKTGNEKGEKLATHAKYKFDSGKNIWDGSVNIYKDTIAALIGRNLVSTLHPTKNRSLTIGEALHIMGFPNDFELLGGRKNMNHICQNVPVCTAADMVRQAKKFINGELILSESDLVKQNNHKQEIDFESNSGELIVDIFNSVHD